ncbi:MAG: hypothetical protein PWR01_320 [Clostridiales bacterium]|nr:hypothetical protein [Clostridiales bacterium]
MVFEDKLDTLEFDFSSIKPEKTARGNIDYLWFTKILKPKAKGKMVNTIDKTVNATYVSDITNTLADNISIQSTHSTSKSTPIVFRDWVYYGDVYRESCWARVYATIVDVPYGGVSTAQTTLELVEYLYINNQFYSNDTNYQIQEAGSEAIRDMYGKIALGYNTMVNNFCWDGNYWVWQNWQFKPQLSVETSLGGGYGIWSAGATLSYSIESPQWKYRQSNYKTSYPKDGKHPKNAIQHIPKSKNICLLDHGDNLFIIANSISTIDSEQAPNVTTTAKFGWTFDIFYYSEGRQDYYTDFGPSLNY